jgi:HTH-type transcriptional regulator, sugar sensing transcriptional regulator
MTTTVDLRRFGFTPTESRVYVALLKVSPATGYTVAREAGLARANTYSALERLAVRGVAARLPGRPARYVAADPATLTGKLDREWKRDLEALTEQLAAVERREAASPSPLHEIIPDRATLLDRIGTCARATHQELLAVVGPWVSGCYAELSRARARGTARILSLGVPAPDGAQVRQTTPGEIAAYWGGLPVAVVSDRRVAVLGLLADQVTASGFVTSHPAVVPFIRHLLRRELAAAVPQRVS